MITDSADIAMLANFADTDPRGNTGREHSSIRTAVKGCLHVNHPKWYSKLENVLNPSRMLLGVVGAGSAALKRPDWRAVGTRH